jgi:hypothetical protein
MFPRLLLNLKESSMSTDEFLIQFHDFLAPKLDTYEQAIYLYIYRHSRLIGLDRVVIGFKSARTRLATGVGEKGKAMAEGTCYEKLRSLQEKGCIEIVSTERSGSRLRVKLPSQIPGVIVATTTQPALSLEDMDFFEIEENRRLLIEREGHKCFYCLRAIGADNYVIEHVVSRPQGNNGYRNTVAACCQCNNRKGSSDAEDFLRVLYREGFLSSPEFEDRLSHLQRLKLGELKPVLSGEIPV